MRNLLISIPFIFVCIGTAHAQSVSPVNIDARLCEAIVNGDTKGVVAAIDMGSDPNSICVSMASQERTAFDVALTSSTSASEQIAAYLITKGVRPDGRNRNKRQWFSNFDSASSHSFGATLAFLRSGVNPETVDSTFFLNTPLRSTLTSKLDEATKLQISDLLIQYGERPSDGQTSQLSFLILSSFDDAFVLDRVIRWNFKQDTFNPGQYLESAAAVRRGIPVLDALVRAGANVRDPVSNSSSALDDYFWNDGLPRKPIDINVVDWLLKRGALADSYSLSMSLKEGNLSVSELLLKNGADPNADDSLASNDVYNKASPLQGAALLIRYGAVAEHLSDTTGLLPLSVAAELNHLQMAKIYISNGADVNLKNSDGTTPLCRAILFKATDVERFLRSKGAELGSCPKI